MSRSEKNSSRKKSSRRKTLREDSSREESLRKNSLVGREAPALRRGRGAASNAAGRYEVLRRCDIDTDFHDGWETFAEESMHARTRWFDDTSRSVITRNQSPDIYFDQSINPYRGCEHGCIYCFARPTHTWLGHSAGLDFERLLYAKRDAAPLLRQELAKPGYRCEPIAVGVNTDAYQPLERELGITRQLLEVMLECRHPVLMITKSSLIERDLDLLQQLAAQHLVTVSISITTLDPTLARNLEPRAASPSRRMRIIKTLADAGVPTRVSVSPIIPALNESEMDAIIQAAADAGAYAASYIILRLPHELATLFPEWLRLHYPGRADRVLKALASMRNSKLYESGFGQRMKGSGPRADIIQQRFELACRRAGLSASRMRKTESSLDSSLFKVPESWCEELNRAQVAKKSTADSRQLGLF